MNYKYYANVGPTFRKYNDIVMTSLVVYDCVAFERFFNFFFFYQTKIIRLVQTKTNKQKKKFLKETTDKTLHYLIAICNIQTVRDYKKYRYISLFQIL